MKLQILSPDTTIYNGHADSVLVPGINNRPFVILDLHTPLISVLEQGYVRYVVNDKEFEINIESGFVEVRKNIVTVCVELKK